MKSCMAGDAEGAHFGQGGGDIRHGFQVDGEVVEHTEELWVLH